MGFKLNIEFSGLCMFVPKAATQSGSAQMYVLLPTPQHAHGADRHSAVLGFDSAHLTPGSTVPTQNYVLTPLAGSHVHIPGGEPVDLAVCREVVNLRDVTNRQVDARHLGASPPPPLLARVVLDGGEMTAVNPGRCWEWVGGSYRHLAFKVQWTVEYSTEDSLAIQVETLRGSGDSREIHLFPLTLEGESPVLNVSILHVPAGDLPPDPETAHHEEMFGFQPEHFRAFYNLFGQAVPVLLPKLWGSKDACGTPSCPPIQLMGGSPFNCMVASDY